MADFAKIPRMLHYGAAASGPNQRAASGPAKASAARIVNDDAAATMSTAVGMQAARTGQKTGEGAPAAMSAETMKDFIEAVREKIAKLIELLEQIATGRFSGSSLTKSFREQAEALNRIFDVLWENAMVTSIPSMGMPSPSAASRPQGYTDTGQALTAFKEELEQVSSSDEFMLGGPGSTGQINTSAQFGPGQVEDVEQNMAESNANLELGVFSLAHMREQAMKAPRSENLQPDRVLFLLQNP
jgi:hypothetical protein